MTLSVYHEKERRLMEAVGRAITRWGNLEFQLLETFSAATKLPLKTTTALFSNIQTFSLKLTLVNSVMCEALHEQYLPHWNSLVEYIRELSGDRNHLAHMPMVMHGHGPPDQVNPDAVDPLIGPSSAKSILKTEDRRDPMDFLEVEQLVEDFQEAVELIMSLTKAMQQPPPLPAKFAQPVVRRRAPAKQRRENARKSRKQPPQS